MGNWRTRFVLQSLLALWPGRRPAAMPCNKFFDAIRKFRGRPVIEQSAGLRNVGARDGHVAGLLRDPVDSSLFAEDVLDRANHVGKGDGIRIAKIE